MRVIALTSRCALNVEGNIREYVEWGRTLATFVARRALCKELHSEQPELEPSISEPECE
ncbi:hypothetical protein TIFTF001_035502 [Ficus carica]|uniref:Uncharacterized protein n=1 Tax=Ficus carica TaxID=3494 RepID=A0AA88E1Q3_FICCA|nr:hypothetical protein TIFTF001_035502 [Ficus carica]